MKKAIISIICCLMFISISSQAKASILFDWNYTPQIIDSKFSNPFAFKDLFTKKTESFALVQTYFDKNKKHDRIFSNITNKVAKTTSYKDFICSLFAKDISFKLIPIFGFDYTEWALSIKQEIKDYIYNSFLVDITNGSVSIKDILASFDFGNLFFGANTTPNDNVSPSPTPEPASMLLTGLGLAGLGLFNRRRKNAN